MSAQRQRKTEKSVSELASEFFDSLEVEHASASQLAAYCERDAKTVRAHLRKIAYRDQSVEKNNTHKIDKETFVSVVEHFAKAKRMQAS